MSSKSLCDNLFNANETHMKLSLRLALDSSSSPSHDSFSLFFISGGLKRDFWETNMPYGGGGRDGGEAKATMMLLEQAAEEVSRLG